jgi:chromosomal replication initiation ATPase DnaA
MVKKLSPARPATVKTSRVKSEGVEKSTPSIQREARPVAATGGESVLCEIESIRRAFSRLESIILRELTAKIPREEIRKPLDFITYRVGVQFGFAVSGIHKKQKDFRRARARMLSIYLQLEFFPEMTLTEIGSHWKMDHTSIIHARNKTRDAIQVDQNFAAKVATVRKEISETLNKNQHEQRNHTATAIC